MKKYVIFLDDERFPAEKTFNAMPIIIARSYDDAIEVVKNNGFPTHVMFDHDLGEGKNGKDFADYLISRDLDFCDMPDDFTFSVHSMNPIGKDNIEKTLKNYLSWKENISRE